MGLLSSLYKPGIPTEVRPLSESETGTVNTALSTREIEYVGVSNNLIRRMREHIRSGKLGGDNDIFAYKAAEGRASQAHINDHEHEKIEQHNPPINRRTGGAGRPYKKRGVDTAFSAFA